MRPGEIGTAVIPREDVGGELEAGNENVSVPALVKLAIEKGVEVEVLERLVALQERVSERNARAAFIEALAAFQQACPPILKTRENAQFQVTRSGVSRKAKYAPLEDIDRVARPVAARFGLVWTWNTTVDATLMHVTCRVLHALGHAEEATVSLPFESKAGSSPQQKFGSAQTYGMRYSLVAALGITTADDDDDGAGGGEPELISEYQTREIEEMIRTSGADRARFLAFLGIDEVGKIPVGKYDQAVQALTRKAAAPAR